MRLTKKCRKHYITNSEIINEKVFTNMFDKLGQLEDIEDELGVDLITLFKALKNGIYFKVIDKLYFTDNLNLDFDQKCLFEIIPPDDAEVYYLDDYGKTWALTKEELL